MNALGLLTPELLAIAIFGGFGAVIIGAWLWAWIAGMWSEQQ